MNIEEEQRQRKNLEERQKRLEKDYQINFYALDTETSGFDYNRPIQIAVVRFDKGVAVEQYNQYFEPGVKMTKSAIDTHGLTEKELKKKDPKKWTKGASEILANFLT